MSTIGWTILIAAASVSVAGAEDPSFEVSRAPGSVRVTLHDVSEMPPESPVIRLVALPAGATDPEVVIVGETAAPFRVEVGNPMSLRGMRVAPLVISPSLPRADRPAGSSRSVEFEIRHRGEAPGVEPVVPSGRGFFAPYEDLLLGAPAGALSSAVDGTYLIVTAPEFVAGLGPLVAWKREIGHTVTVVTTTETGTTNLAIQDYVESVYETAPIPPQYLLLVGDVEQIPGFDYHGSVSDLPYSLLDGDDFLPDLEVGRLSVQNGLQLETVVAKILCYEQDPMRDGDRAWFSQGLVVAGNMGSSTPVPTSRWCREQLLDPAVGYTAVDSVYYPPVDAVGPYYIRPFIDTGVSIVSYRGWALGISGWDAPQFTTGDIPSLSNGWKLPVVFSFVCLNGNFAEPECFGEGWIRAGTPTEPKGAVAFLGNSEHWSHTRFNDSAAIGAFDAIRGQGVRRMGQILNAARAQVLEQFPDQMYYDPWADESVEFYYYIYAVLGDPSLEIWMGEPRTITVTHPASIAQGSTLLEVAVLDESGTTPVSGARVGVSQGDTVLGSARTDASGLARVLSAFESTAEPVKITVTGTGLAPYRTSVSVGPTDAYLAAESMIVDDDATGASLGNGDGIANPGETLELTVGARNRGVSPAIGVSGLLDAGEGATVQVGGVAWPDLDPGELASSLTPFIVAIDPAAEDGQIVRLRLELVAGADTSASGFDLAVRAPSLRYEAHSVGGDGVLDPEDTAALTVTVLNDGSARASAAQAVLRTATPDLVTITDSTGAFDPVAVGLTATTVDPFEVVVAGTAATGQAAVFTLTTTTQEGAVSTTSFSIVVGRVDHRAPLGPDAYGYYAYDNSDTDYPDAVPVYDWIPISTVYGGAGTALGLEDASSAVVGLPFPFVYYGQTYDSLLVSDNGWASFELTPYVDFYNWSVPNTYGTGAQLAPFWDNLDPTKSYEGVPVGDGIYVFDDTANHRFIVEWSRLGNLRSQHQEENRPDWDDLQTFQLILLDPVHYPTPTGDGIVRFQYKQIVNNDNERMYATVGIENETEDVGIEYTYTNRYPPASAPLSSGLVIDFQTTPPRYRPFRLLGFDATRTESGVRLRWEPGDDRPRKGTRVYRANASGGFDVVAGGFLEPDVTEFLDTFPDPDSPGLYKIGSVDPVGHETLFGPFVYEGKSGPAIRLALDRTGPNPSRGPVPLRYSIPNDGHARLSVYAVSGRRVRTLLEGAVDAGSESIVWDGRDDHDVPVASGVYFVELDTGSGRRGTKVVLLR